MDDFNLVNKKLPTNQKVSRLLQICMKNMLNQFENKANSLINDEDLLKPDFDFDFKPYYTNSKSDVYFDSNAISPFGKGNPFQIAEFSDINNPSHTISKTNSEVTDISEDQLVVNKPAISSVKDYMTASIFRKASIVTGNV